MKERHGQKLRFALIRTAFGRCSGKEYQNCWTTPTGLTATPPDVREFKGEKRSSYHHNVYAKKKKNSFLGGQLFAEFCFSWEILESNYREMQGVNVN